MVHVGVNVHPALEVNVCGVGVVGRRVVAAQRVELAVIEPWIAEALEVDVIDVAVDRRRRSLFAVTPG